VTQNEAKLRADALAIFRGALAAADAGNAVRKHLHRIRWREFDRIFLLCVGKAATAMAEAIVAGAKRPIHGGIVVTKHGHVPRRLEPFRYFESGHPIPDEQGRAAALAVEDLLHKLDARDLLICAISGGASALLPAPVAGLSLAAKQRLTDALLRAGANIHELNTVRKHVSRLKGGQLAALAYPATVITLLLSDVIGDDPAVIGSGPTVPDPSTIDDARAVLNRYRIRKEQPLRETPKPGDEIFDKVENVIVGSNRLALDAAAREAKRLGYRPLILSSTMHGEAREVARVHAQIAREVRTSGNPLKPPACILSGGETTVTVRGDGKGGRNQEFALAVAIDIAGLDGILVLSAGTDGTDGPTDAAGAIASGTTLSRAADARDYLNRNDSYSYFEKLGDLIETGPTGTNVMDVHLLLIEGQ
jgi:hydroxypyruvate reductase